MSTYRDGREPSSVGRRAMSNGMCIALIVAGAILRFALTARSPHGLNVHVVGDILILAGALGLILPFLTRLQRHRSSRPAVPDRRSTYSPNPAGGNQAGYDDRPVLVSDDRHLVRPAQHDNRYDVES
jgi:hypothetical protein